MRAIPGIKHRCPMMRRHREAAERPWRSRAPHRMPPPCSNHAGPGCSFTADPIGALPQHIEQADLALAAILRASIERIEAVNARTGWIFALAPMAYGSTSISQPTNGRVSPLLENRRAGRCFDARNPIEVRDEARQEQNEQPGLLVREAA